MRVLVMTRLGWRKRLMLPRKMPRCVNTSATGNTENLEACLGHDGGACVWSACLAKATRYPKCGVNQQHVWRTHSVIRWHAKEINIFTKENQFSNTRLHVCHHHPLTQPTITRVNTFAISQQHTHTSTTHIPFAQIGRRVWRDRDSFGRVARINDALSARACVGAL